MSKKRRNFTARFKADLVLEVLKGEKELNVIATENNIQPNLLRNWKKEFEEHAAAVFDTRKDDWMEKKLQEEKKAKEEYAKKVGQLTMQIDWLEKNLQKSLDQTTRVNLVQSLLTNNDSNLSISKASELMGISRSSVYYTPAPPSEEELECKRIIDVLHTDNPSWGSRQMSMQLKSRGFNVGRRKARRYMDEMAIDPIYPKKKKKKDMPESKIYPYLLRNANIIRPNQAWSIDITYIPMPKGYAYLTAIIDWYSRYLVEWELDETLALWPVVNAVKKAFKIAKPEIFNSDQGIQFRSPWYSYILSENNVKQSMDGRGRWPDNIMIERWFRSLKHEEVYLTSYNNIREDRFGIGKYIHTYNFERFHSALDGMTPAEAFYPIQLIEEAKNYY